MTLTAKDVAEITKLLEESSFDELYLELDGVKLSLRRGAAAHSITERARPEGGAAAARSAAASTAASAAAPVGSAMPVRSARHAGPATADSAESVEPAAGAGAARPAASIAPAGAVAAPAGSTSQPSRAPQSAAAPGLHDITSPLLGTFYRAPKPGAPPFVEVGSPVEEETIIGIIEVMKLMNTVRAGVRGRVTEILARDGALVEYGEALMRVAKAG